MQVADERLLQRVRPIHVRITKSLNTDYGFNKHSVPRGAFGHIIQMPPYSQTNLLGRCDETVACARLALTTAGWLTGCRGCYLLSRSNRSRKERKRASSEQIWLVFGAFEEAASKNGHLAENQAKRPLKSNSPGLNFGASATNGISVIDPAHR